MKTQLSRLACILFLSTMFIFSCSTKNKDEEIQASIVEKTAANSNMKGITTTVSSGVVTLSGQCPDEACKASVEETVKSIKNVEQVVNNITVVPVAAPVVISPDQTLKTSLDSLIRSYQGVFADVNDGVVKLRGQVKNTDLQNLLQAVHALHPKQVQNELVIIK